MDVIAGTRSQFRAVEVTASNEVGSPVIETKAALRPLPSFSSIPVGWPAGEKGKASRKKR
jgi:hypothetical protein